MTPDKFYEKFAREYDELAVKHHWYSPDLLFGLTYPFVPDRGALIDIGIGTGLSSSPFYRLSYNITGMDISPQMLSLCDKKHLAGKLVLHDIRETPWPFKTSAFDLAISNGVLYFLEDLEKIFAEVYRILPPGGIFAFNVEPSRYDEENNYTSLDNSVIATTVPAADGLVVYRHSDEYIHTCLKSSHFELIRSVRYHAYYSPTEKRDVFFNAYVAKRL